nr:hypothetical protein [Nostoc sp. CreGUA01]
IVYSSPASPAPSSSSSPPSPISPSPHLPISPSPHLPISPCPIPYPSFPNSASSRRITDASLASGTFTK